MKKSEFINAETNRLFELEGWSLLIPEHHKRVELTVEQRVEVIERAGFTWEPEDSIGSEDGDHAAEQRKEGTKMRRSELRKAVEQIMRPAGEAGRAIDLDYLEEFLAERAGITWEPEELEVLWEVPTTPSWTAFRIMSDGSIRLLSQVEGEGWRTLPEPSHPIFRELARRLLAERQTSSAMDQGFKAGRRAAKDLFNREHATDGSPCWCEPKTESPWHDEVEKRLKVLEDLLSWPWELVDLVEDLPLAVSASHLKAKDQKSDETP